MFILGQKINQTQLFDDKGDRIPVTFIKTSPCYIVSISPRSVKLGFGLAKNIKKPVLGELKKAGIKTPLRFLREFRVNAEDEMVKALKAGEEVKPAAMFIKGDKVKVSGTSKGKGFQGAVRRHGFHGGPKTHGQSDRHRAPGSIGSGTTPGRIVKGKRMAGRMGGEIITVKGLEVIEVKDDGIVVKGLVPGYKTGLLEVVTTYRNARTESTA